MSLSGTVVKVVFSEYGGDYIKTKDRQIVGSSNNMKLDR